ncbi:MAG: ATP-dependent DNA helicase [Turicibacter sp.]|nr:ATP-dependent DNA helicase [Turicibacter sp.]
MKIQQAIKDIVGYVYQSGDLNLEYFSVNRAQLGTHAHQVVQKQYRKDECEVPVAHTMRIDEHEVIMNGRLDLLLKGNSGWVVGEIKSTTRNLDHIRENDRPNHYAQAKFYAYILLLQNPKLAFITVRLIYCDLDGDKTRSFDQVYMLDELEEFVRATLRIYIDWALVLIKSQQQKLKTAKALDFPFGEFRTYQRQLSGTVYQCIKEEKNLLLRAPTGIGKTMATIFPSLKALTNAEQKVFYFTAKTMGRTVAEKAFAMCQKQGLAAKVTTITAKEKICFMDEARCDPAYCPYAKGYFDRQREAIRDLFESEFLFDRTTIETYAKKHEICPFEFSLSMASVSDAVIGDYNYLFDPRAFLRRFFEEPTDHIALVDEAHNLYERACEMFSASLSVGVMRELEAYFKGRHGPLTRALRDLIVVFDGYAEETMGSVFLTELDDELLVKVERAMQVLEKYLYREHDADDRSLLMNFYFELLQFWRISDFYTESFRFHLEASSDDFKASIICLNPGEHLAARLRNVKAGILFSATLHPLDYFQTILLNDEPAEQLFLPSPFEREHLDIRVNHGLSTKYRDRDFTAAAIVRHIYEMTRAKQGNYLVFFPSYQYMEQIFEPYDVLAGAEQNVVMQQRNMNENEREEFLSLFNLSDEKSLVAFAVLGGIFSEGIDLIGDSLIGAVIVGVGLPQINPLTEERRAYFEATFGAGYRYAYVIPGFNKVMQAVGRVIRTESDQGSVLLIDSRYMQEEYLALFPYEWQHARFVRG